MLPRSSFFAAPSAAAWATLLGGVTTLLLAAGVVWWLFPQVLQTPNDFFLEPGGDGIQSYFATAWYALYDRSGNHFSGMNYPYGENINYPNLQPLVAVLMGQAQQQGWPAGQYTVAITNLLALGGLVLAPVVVYAILRRRHLPVTYAVFAALCIAFLTPQLPRLGPHTSLSYSAFIPLLWYFAIRMQEEPARWRWYAWFAGSSLLMGGMMLYFLATACFFLLGHAALLWWLRPQQRPLLWRMVLAAVVPILLYRGFIFLTDPITDRPPNPYGLLIALTTPGSVFLPLVGPLAELRQQYFPGDAGEFEGFAYIGLVAGGALLAAGLRALGRALGRRRAGGRWRRPALPLFLITGLGASALLLVLAMGIPLKWSWFAWFTDHSGPIKQFRALGRFAWSFYYVAGVFAAYWLYRQYRWLRRRRRAAWALLLLPLLGLWAAEAWINVSTRAGAVARVWGAASFVSPATGLTPLLQQAGYQPQDFQAIVPLPFLCNGTDKILFTGSEQSIYLSEQMALATGVPLFSSYISRASIAHALRHVQIFSTPLIGKDILADFPNQKPLLLLATHEYLLPHEQRLLASARLLVHTPEADLYALPLRALAVSTVAAELARADSLLPHLPARPGGLRSTTPAGVLVEDYRNSPDRRGRLGAGARYEPAQQFTMLYDGPLPAPADTGAYEAALWMHGKMAYGYGNMQVKTYRGDQMLVHAVVDAKPAAEVSGDWVRVAVPFRAAPGITRIEVLYDSRDLLVDDFIIRPLGADVYYYGQHNGRRVLVKNGYPLVVAPRLPGAGL